MNRLYVIEWQSRYGETATLPEICMDLRSGVNGMAEEWSPEAVLDCVNMLKARVATWHVFLYIGRSTNLDEAIRQMIIATIEEVESYDWWQQEKKDSNIIQQSNNQDKESSK